MRLEYFPRAYTRLLPACACTEAFSFHASDAPNRGMQGVTYSHASDAQRGMNSKGVPATAAVFLDTATAPAGGGLRQRQRPAERRASDIHLVRVLITMRSSSMLLMRGTCCDLSRNQESPSVSKNSSISRERTLCVVFSPRTARLCLHS